MTIQKKVIVITGAASGIGRSTAKLFAEKGAYLFLSDINEDGLMETFESLGEYKKNTEILKVDVRKPKEVKHMIERVIKRFKRIDVIIANAGVVRVGSIEKFSNEDYELLIDVNLKGTFFTCKYAVPHLKKQKSGVIITLASVAAHIGQKNHANYCSTKHGILGFTKALALDLASFGIRVNSVSPGATDTPMLQIDVAQQAKDRGVSYEVVKKEFEQEGVLGRWAKPEEIAKGILFLASEESSYMTGADLKLDGGWTAR